MFRRIFKKMTTSLTLAVMVALLLVTSLALADNLFADADGLAPVASNTTIDFGDVCAGQTYAQNVLFAARRNGNYPNSQVWANGATVTVAAGTPTGTGLSASIGDATIALPSDWDDADNNELSTDTALATVTLVPVGTGTGNVTFSGSGAGSSGGTTTRSETINVSWTVIDCTPADITAPVISYVLDPAFPDGDNGWYTSDVTLTWTVEELESPGSLLLDGCDDQNITADQFATGYSCSATSDGGSAGPVTVTIKRDATAPEVSLIGGPADGESYYFGSVPGAPTCDASDATSGLAGACTLSGYSNLVGTYTVTASASDNAGNSASDSATYSVLAWTLSGFYQPVDMNDVYNVVKGGSTVPLKFEVFAGSTELTDVNVVKSFTFASVVCGTGVGEDLVELTTTGGTSLRYDLPEDQFIQNWKTPKTTGCFKVTMTTLDGSSLVAYFKLK